MNLSEWLDNYRMIDFDRDHWCATGKDLERLWEFRGKQATAAQRERLCCGHPAACLEGGSSDPDAQVTMWCGACVAEDKVRAQATAAELVRCAAICDEVAEKWKLDAWNSITPKGTDEAMNIANGAIACAAAIRQTI